MNGQVLYFICGACILTLLAAKIAGRRKLAAWLDIVARMVFGIISVAVCFTSGGAFRYIESVTHKDQGPAPNWNGYLLFGALGVVALFTGIRAIPRVLRGDYSNAEEETD